MDNNYDAWNIDHKDFSAQRTQRDRLSFLIRYAVLAPSSHNSQPWRFLVGDGTVDVWPEYTRALPRSDTNHRQLYISIGCALENLLIAADYFGFTASVQYIADERGDVAARVSFATNGTCNNTTDHLVHSIPKRHTNRSKYSENLPEGEFLSYIRSLAGSLDRIHIVSNKDQKDPLANVLVDAGIAAMNDRGFREELSRYVKNNFTTSSVGMPGFTLGVPTPLSLILPSLLRRLNMNKAAKKQDLKLLRSHTPALVVLSTKDDEKSDWIRAGRLYEEIALEAERSGVRTAPMAAAVQIGEFYKKIQGILGSDFRPQMVFRLGYSAKSMPHSPRLIHQEVTEPVSIMIP